MQRVLFFLYGVGCHAMFLAVYAYLGLFVTGLVVPKTIDGPVSGPIWLAIWVNTLLLVLFGVQHSVMARPGFKAWWTRIIPEPIERSTYVLISNVLMIVMFVFWQPIDLLLWDVHQPLVYWSLWALCAAGWLIVPLATLLINHFDLMGTRQVWLHLRGKAYTHLPFAAPVLYKVVRHPLYVGWIMAFWFTPTMTLGHLQFAAILTGYILIAIRYEESDLADAHGEAYAAWRDQTPMLIPGGPTRAGTAEPTRAVLS